MTVDITKRTVPILAETKKNEKKKKIQGLLEKNFNKERLRKESTTEQKFQNRN